MIKYWICQRVGMWPVREETMMTSFLFLEQLGLSYHLLRRRLKSSIVSKIRSLVWDVLNLRYLLDNLVETFRR